MNWFRNGILHQAEIKGSSRILISKETPLVEVANDDNGLIINRYKFHEQLVKEFKDYIDKLKKNNPDLRKKFKYKMDAICKCKN